MSTIRNEGTEVKHTPRATRTDTLKEATPVATDPIAGSTQLLKDEVSLPARREEPSRSLPDLSSWGDHLSETASGLADKASGLADKVLDTGKKVWEGVSETLGFESKDNTGQQAGASGATAGGASASAAAPPANASPTGSGSAQAGQTEQAQGPGPGEKPKGPQLQGIPPRPEDARGGKEFMESIKNLKPGPERDKAILDEIMKGNIPEASRDLKEVTVDRKGKDGQSHELTMHVMPDYLSVGSNEDNVRIPMTPAVAQAIADKTGTSLPTDRMVDDIAAKSKKLHLDPFQWKPGNEHARNMQSVDHYQKHDERIDAQLGTGLAQGDLISGHKKDLVIPNKDGKVAIYGGYWPGTEKRVQPYSNLHENTYEDYSHGARLVSQDVTIDGKAMKLSEVLADPNLAPLVTRFPPTSNGEPAGLSNRYDVPERLQQ